MADGFRQDHGEYASLSTRGAPQSLYGGNADKNLYVHAGALPTWNECRAARRSERKRLAPRVDPSRALPPNAILRDFRDPLA
jgi:hypothetical protein